MPVFIALQSSNNRKIDLYSNFRENVLQALTKMVVTYKGLWYGAAIFTIALVTYRGID